MVSCSISGCDVTHTNNPQHFRFHRFPTNILLREKWLRIANRSYWNPKRSSAICSKHFEDKCFIKRKRHILMKGSLPTLYLPNSAFTKVRSEAKSLSDTMHSEFRDDVPKRQRLRKMSVEEDETTISNEVGLPECRTCLKALSANSVLVDLFQCWVPPWDGMESTIAEDLAKLANIQITQVDQYSKVICEPCCLKLQSACDFASSVRKNDRILQQRYPPAQEELNVCIQTVWPKPIRVDKNVTETVYQNVMEIEIKQEVLSDDEYTHTNGLEEHCKVSQLEDLDIKIEPEELIQTTQSVKLENDEEETETHMLSPVILNGDVSLGKKTDSLNLIHIDERNGLDDTLENRIKEEPISEDDKEDMDSDIPLNCLLCTKVFNSISGLKAHVIAEHSYKSVRRKTSNSPEKKRNHHKYVCETCQRRFRSSTDLMVHKTCHDKSVCYACSAKFDTFDQLTRHSQQCKVIANKKVSKPKTLDDVKRPAFKDVQPTNSSEVQAPPKQTLKCPLCNEEFSDNYYLNIHQEIHHPVNELKKETLESDSVKMVVDNLESIFGED